MRARRAQTLRRRSWGAGLRTEGAGRGRALRADQEVQRAGAHPQGVKPWTPDPATAPGPCPRRRRTPLLPIPTPAPAGAPDARDFGSRVWGKENGLLF